MRILFVLEYYLPYIGGVETVFQEIAERLIKLGHEVNIVTMKLPGTLTFEEIRGVKVHRIPVPKTGSRYWFDFLFSIPKTYALAKHSDIIHASDYVTAFPVWFVGRIQNKPCIMTVTEPIGNMWHSVLGINYFKGKIFQLLEKMLFCLPFDKYACISHYTQNCLRFMGIHDNRMKTIYLGVDATQFNSDRIVNSYIRERYSINDKFVYLSFGRPGITKGIDYLIKAVPIISVQIPNSVLLLILSKDPPERYELLKKIILDMHLNNVILIDPVPRVELPDYIGASDCVVVPSLTEGFGFTAAEACAMGKPVVATNVGSLPEVVSGKFILVEPRDSEAIASAVIQIARGEVVTTPKKCFSWDKCVEQYLALYRMVLR